MSETKTSATAAEQQKATSAFFGSALNTSTEAVLKAQAELLTSTEVTVTAWLHRRREDVVETQNLIARLRASSDPAEFASAQQEWASGAFRRLTADAAELQSAAQQFMSHAIPWFGQGAEKIDHFAAKAADATRSTVKTLQVPART
jgi:hypothetical protein